MNEKEKQKQNSVGFQSAMSVGLVTNCSSESSLGEFLKLDVTVFQFLKKTPPLPLPHDEKPGTAQRSLSRTLPCLLPRFPLLCSVSFPFSPSV
jgi:hypothetical protein